MNGKVITPVYDNFSNQFYDLIDSSEEYVALKNKVQEQLEESTYNKQNVMNDLIKQAEVEDKKFIVKLNCGKHEDEENTLITKFIIDKDNKNTRIYTFIDDKGNNFLMEYYIGTDLMNQPIFYRAIDTKNKDINIPKFFGSLDYNYWK